jgi:ATP-dependent Lon protease
MVLLKKSIRSRQMVVNEINLGGSIELIHNTISITEIAVEKGTPALLMPVTIRY